MAKRENHEKRTDLYSKALSGKDLQQGRDDNAVIGAMGGPVGTFIMKPASITDPGSNSPLIADPGGTKWLPPKKDD